MNEIVRVDKFHKGAYNDREGFVIPEKISDDLEPRDDPEDAMDRPVNLDPG